MPIVEEERNGEKWRIFKPRYAQKLCSIAQNKLCMNFIEVLSDFAKASSKLRWNFEAIMILNFCANLTETSNELH